MAERTEKMQNMAEARYLNRELSWLEFNQRVLDEAANSEVPLLERMQFLAIAAANLDEFIMVRVGGLKLLASEGVTEPDPAGLPPGEQLRAINERAHRMSAEKYRVLTTVLEPRLEEEGIKRITPERTSHAQVSYLQQIFDQEISAVISPIAVSGTERFPLLRNLGRNLAVRLKSENKRSKQRFVVIPLGVALGRIFALPAESGFQYILLEDVIRLFVEKLFPGEKVAECTAFRITRNADLSAGEDEAPDFLMQMEHVLAARKKSGCVRLQIEENVTKGLLSFLRKRLKVNDDDVFKVPGPMDLSFCSKVAETEGFEHLKAPSWVPVQPPGFSPDHSIFDILSRRNLAVIHPYESFEPVLKLIEEAAVDPDVLAMKQVLYRTARNSPIVQALCKAAENGKNVTAVVELKARFDEARNIEWANRLEEAGVQVIYGVKGLKTHAKVLLVVRREPRGIVRYVHYATGNYNEKTAKVYTDVSYMTSNEDLGADASAFFNTVTGYTQPHRFLKIQMAPLGLREQLLELIRGEAERCRQGQKGIIKAKMNSLSHTEIIDALYDASQAGVDIQLNVRGICCLRPGVEGLSENIRVVSVIDEFLEHGRILYFYHGGEEAVYISSADWMPRNLDRRIELLVPIEDNSVRVRLIEVLDTCLADTVKGRELLADGSYRVNAPERDAPRIRSQRELCERARNRALRAAQAEQTVLEPHRSVNENRRNGGG